MKVFVLAGQSNMEGQAVVDLTGPDCNGGKGTLTALMADPTRSAIYSHLKQADGRWTVRNDVWVHYQRENQPLLAGPLGIGFSVYGDQHHFGPELEFGHVVGDFFKQPVLIVKTAWGGKSLFRDFRPPSSGGEIGRYYKLIIAQIRDAMSNAGREFPLLKGRRCELAGFVWYHGWNDGVEPKTAVPEYEQNLVNLIKDVRHEFDVPSMPVVIGELTGPWVKAEGGWDQLRQAQAAAALHTELGKTVVFVPTHDFVRRPEDSPNPGHGHHEFGNAETYFLVGEALGNGMLSLHGAKPKKIQTITPVPIGATNNTIKDYGLKSYTRTSKLLPHKEDQPWKLVCAIPYNCQFQPWIEARAEGGKEIRLNSTNPLVLYLTPTETVTTIEGSHSYEAKNWVSGEGAVYTIPAGVTVTAVKYRETGYNTKLEGSFQSDDEDLNVLWKKAARTAYLCMRDHFYDCPDRERVGFWGDGTPELDTCFYAFDSNSHQLCKELVLRPLQPKFYPGQHLEFLGEYGIWYYYLHTGDLASIKSVYSQTKEFLFKTYKTGDKNTWFDWGVDSKDTTVLETCFLYSDLGALRKLAIETGHNEDLGEIDARREAIRSTFDSRYWKSGWYQSSDVTKPDDRANAMAVNSGLAGPEKWSAIYGNVLSKTTNASCFFDRWVFEALCKMGLEEKALARMTSRYKTMIPAPFTTLWEHYDRWWASWLNAFDDASSLNHGWNPPVINLSQDIVGVRPIEPGWNAFEVLPKEASLTSIKARVPTVKGPVQVELHKSATEYSINVSVPANSRAVVGIPKRSFQALDSVSVNGMASWQSNRYLLAKGFEPIVADDRYIKFGVGPGTWRIVGKGKLPVKVNKHSNRPQKREVSLEKRAWTALASVPDGSFLFSGNKIPVDVSAANAIDGDHWTGWRDMSQTQHPGQWFQVDMKRRENFNEIILENSWALWDSPHSYTVTVSDDGNHWSAPIANGSSALGITKIEFPRQTARFVRITQTGSDPTYHWSIYEIDILSDR